MYMLYFLVKAVLYIIIFILSLRKFSKLRIVSSSGPL